MARRARPVPARLWSGTHHRGVQLHDLREAVIVWATKYGQRAWLRQLDSPVTRETEDAVLRTIARLDGTPFPSTVRLASRWLRGRAPARYRARHGAPGDAPGDAQNGTRGGAQNGAQEGPRGGDLATAYCAEVVAVTYQAMGLLPDKRRPNWYDAGRFWSGDDLALSAGARLSGEIARGRPIFLNGCAAVT